MSCKVSSIFHRILSTIIAVLVLSYGESFIFQASLMGPTLISETLALLSPHNLQLSQFYVHQTLTDRWI